MKKISVIVPVYNTYAELNTCLSSIRNQTYSNLEIICVDDGSTDGSEKIVDDFANKDSRFIPVHQKNAGESNARNTGLKLATGDVIAFCDCDDWIDRDMYEVLITAMSESGLDMAAAGWYKNTASAQEIITNRLPVSADVFGRDALLNYLYRRDDYRGFAYMWDKLYRREILENIYFDETLKLGGDVLYLAEAAVKAQRIRYIDRPVYHYYQRETSGCHTKDVWKLRDWLLAYEKVIDIFEANQINEEIIDYVKRFLAYHSSNAAETAINQGNLSAKECFQTFMRKYGAEYVHLNRQYPDRISRYMRIMNG